MYQKYFGLAREPFLMTPDPGFLYFTNEHREALAGLTYAILGRKGFVVLTGDAGTGKTTLIAKVLQSVPATRVYCSVVLNPTLTPEEFLEFMLMDLGITPVPASKAQRLQLLRGLLLEADKQGRVPVLIVDEAHKVAPDVLEEIRLLSNFEKPEGKLLQIVLAGQSELGDILNQEHMRQLKQRISVRLSLHPLTHAEIELYINHRWLKAGGVSPHPFSAEAITQLVKQSRGIPRLINVICDNALLLAFAMSAKVVGPAEIQSVAADLELSSECAPVKATVSPAVSPVVSPVAAAPNRAANNVSGPAGPVRLLERELPPKKPSFLTRLTTRMAAAR
jgi:general secretion pathway protein A